LKKTRIRIFLTGRRKSARITGRFASPSRRKGRGLGIAFSMAARKRHRAERKYINFTCVESDITADILA